MSGIVYPSGPQSLKIPTTILLPSTATPFNPSAVNPGTEACWDAVKATEYYGFYKTTFDAAQPPYPAGGSFYNSGTYQLNGKIKFNTPSNPLEHTAVRTYSRVCHLLAYANTDTGGNYWDLGYNFVPPKGYFRQQNANMGPSSSAGLVFDVELPSNCVVTRAYIKFKPKTGHSALPSSEPTLDVYMVDSVNGTTTLVASVQSNAANFTVYESSIQTISVTFSQIFDAGRYRIFLKFFGEHGSNTLDELEAYLPVVEFERLQIGEEFGELVP